jgi:ketosteroid isomerase-like protein
MSEQRSKIKARVEAFVVAVNRRDWGAFLAEIDPEPEYTPIEENVTYRGREALTGYLERWFEVWDDAHLDLDEIQVAPTEDRLFAAFRFSGRGKGSEVAIEGPIFHVVELRDGRYHRVAEFSYRDEALAAYRQTE